MSSPRLSVVLISYNMARELPRTILSLSPSLQRDIGADDYEIILVDNGSTQPFDHDRYLELSPNLTIHRMDGATPSPVPAINYGLRQARGELVGVFIDGARLASPRLLASALDAASLHTRPVIGAISFHLGPDVQSKSAANGYSAEVEDRLLESIDWTADAYRLFQVSTFASSSAEGWLAIPAETNALFLTRDHWRELGGYDESFVSVGGGLANLDIWRRVCSDPRGKTILLLGEATFHQIHGGVATNASDSPWPIFHEEYRRIRGMDYQRPSGTPRLFGQREICASAAAVLSTSEGVMQLPRTKAGAS